MLCGGRAAGAPIQPGTDRDRRSDLAWRLAREPQIAALEAVAAWAQARGVSAPAVNGMREIIEVFAADPEAPNLDLAMRARRLRIVEEFRRRDCRG